MIQQHELPARNNYWCIYSDIISVSNNVFIILNIRNVKNA